MEEDEESFKAADLGSTAYIPPMFDASEDITAPSSQPSPPTRPARGRSSTYFQAFVHPPPAPAPASTTPLSSQSPSISQVMSVASAMQTGLASATSTVSPRTSQSSTDVRAANAIGILSAVAPPAHERLAQPAWSSLDYHLPTHFYPARIYPAHVFRADVFVACSHKVPRVTAASEPAKGAGSSKSKGKAEGCGDVGPSSTRAATQNAVPVVAADDDEPTGGEDGQAELAAISPPTASEEVVLPAGAPMTGEAREESARIHCEERALRETRNEMLRRSKLMEEQEVAADAAKKRLRNPAGGADLVVVARPQCFAKAAKNLDGSPVVGQPGQRRGEIGGTTGQPAGALDAQRAKDDAALLGRRGWGEVVGNGCEEMEGDGGGGEEASHKETAFVRERGGRIGLFNTAWGGQPA
ncbi:hypothetical protein DFH08DRAFT_943690 [Mycena albidolilacea]|uniref:Uncharacterized protein n=1 Tax=Mycena albidolilacea TaxID=1033008 RepID=A0AAD6Z998_9AGAR|nr:hypothetical protein DFH08DRAFT_943690 [Mycena albidolilacea]